MLLLNVKNHIFGKETNNFWDGFYTPGNPIAKKWKATHQGFVCACGHSWKRQSDTLQSLANHIYECRAVPYRQMQALCKHRKVVRSNPRLAYISNVLCVDEDVEMN